MVKAGGAQTPCVTDGERQGRTATCSHGKGVVSLQISPCPDDPWRNEDEFFFYPTNGLLLIYSSWMSQWRDEEPPPKDESEFQGRCCVREHARRYFILIGDGGGLTKERAQAGPFGPWSACAGAPPEDKRFLPLWIIR
nr:unnamed protein product [Digitaria exilis]